MDNCRGWRVLDLAQPMDSVFRDERGDESASDSGPCGDAALKIYLPNSANLQNILGFLKKIDPSDPSKLEFSTHPRWVNVHPVVIALAACAGATVSKNGGTFSGDVQPNPSLNYLLRTKLFDFVPIPCPQQIKEHEEAGRFIPLTRIRNNEELKDAITNMVPLLHAPAEVADPIRYVFSEMVRNVLEHAISPVGAIVAAQYYRESNRIAIGIADSGIGILNHMSRHHRVRTSKDAIALALQPGISGTTARVGGTEFNAGAGLFFTKSIAAFSQNYFMLYSGDAAYRLMRGDGGNIALHADPLHDKHKFDVGLPNWPGTVIGIDLSVKPGAKFSALLNQIRRAYHIDVKQKKNYAKKIRFAK